MGSGGARVGEHAADLTAEVFARAWLSRSRFRAREDVPALPWLLGIAQNVLRDSLRKRRVEDAARRRLGLPRATASDRDIDAVDERLSVPESTRHVVSSLPEQSSTEHSCETLSSATFTAAGSALQFRPSQASLLRPEPSCSARR